MVMLSIYRLGIITRFKQLATIAAEACGYSPAIIGMSDKPSGVFARAGDTGKQRSLGFTPTIDLKTGIFQAIEYYDRLL